MMNWNHFMIIVSISVLIGVGFELMPAFGDCSDYYGKNTNDCFTYTQHPNLTFDDFTMISETDPRSVQSNAKVVTSSRHLVEFYPDTQQDRDNCRYTIFDYTNESYYDPTSSFMVEGKVDSDTLKHEQGHWDLTEYQTRAVEANMLMLQDIPRTCQYFDNDTDDVYAIADSYEPPSLQHRYDVETTHQISSAANDQENQEMWYKKIDCLLKSPTSFSFCEILYPTPIENESSVEKTPVEMTNTESPYTDEELCEFDSFMEFNKKSYTIKDVMHVEIVDPSSNFDVQKVDTISVIVVSNNVKKTLTAYESDKDTAIFLLQNLNLSTFFENDSGPITASHTKQCSGERLSVTAHVSGFEYDNPSTTPTESIPQVTPTETNNSDTYDETKVQTFDVTLHPGDTQEFGINAGGTGEFSIYTRHQWWDVSDSYSSWVSPQQLDFGESLPGSEPFTQIWTVTIPEDASFGNHLIQWVGNCEYLPSESLCSSNNVFKYNIRIVPNDGGGCLIATATYGSELSPQVQQLRELRDNSLLQTESGISFMNGFNSFYYSFSPFIADYERENPIYKELVKVMITPMISLLSILNYVEMDSEKSVLGYGISLIVLNLAMYVGVPASVIVGVRKLI